MDLSEQVWKFYHSKDNFDQSIESKLVDMANKLKNTLIQTYGTSIFELLAQKFCLILNIYGSMMGKSIQTRLLFMVQLTRVFGITQLYYFESRLHQVNLIPDDLEGTMYGLVRKIYKKETGSTELESIFNHFRTKCIYNKNVIIITDGDYDPKSYSSSNYGSSNSFHFAPKSEQKLKYVVVNVKETLMNFPYLGMDHDVCYVTGNNPKTLNGLIKALVI